MEKETALSSALFFWSNLKTDSALRRQVGEKQVGKPGRQRDTTEPDLMILKARWETAFGLPRLGFQIQGQ